MAKRIPEPSISVRTPHYEISDQTAMTKARRLMKELKQYAGVKTFEKNLVAMGYRPDLSPTRRWQAVLKMPAARDDLFGAWYDKKGHIMARPDAKKTDSVQLWFLASNTPPVGATDDSWTALNLMMVALRRREVLNPQTAINQLGTVIPLVTVSLHALQRMIQRGFVLTERDEISFSQLLECLVQVWAFADDRYHEERVLPAEYKIQHGGAIFVIKAKENYFSGEVSMTLITMYSKKP